MPQLTRLATAAVVALFLLVPAGCGGDSEGDGSTASEQTTSTSETTTGEETTTDEASSEDNRQALEDFVRSDLQEQGATEEQIDCAIEALLDSITDEELAAEEPPGDLADRVAAAKAECLVVDGGPDPGTGEGE